MISSCSVTSSPITLRVLPSSAQCASPTASSTITSTRGRCAGRGLRPGLFGVGDTGVAGREAQTVLFFINIA